MTRAYLPINLVPVLSGENMIPMEKLLVDVGLIYHEITQPLRFHDRMVCAMTLPSRHFRKQLSLRGVAAVKEETCMELEHLQQLQ